MWSRNSHRTRFFGVESRRILAQESVAVRIRNTLNLQPPTPITPLTNPASTQTTPYPSPPTPTIPLYHIDLLYVYLCPSVIITSLFFYLIGTGHHQPHHLSYYTLLGTNHCEAQHYTMLMVDVPVRDVQRDVTSHHP